MNEQVDIQAVISRIRVKALLGGIADSSLDKWIADGRFPRSFHIGGGRQAFFWVHEVDNWMRSQGRVTESAQAATV